MKRPSYQWYPGDWKRDVSVQSCSFEARALWREMLDILHDGKPYGHLTTGAVPLTPADLARRLHISTARVEKYLAELERWKVFSKTAKGIIYSRRMIRDEKVRRARAAGGAKSLENENVPRPKHEKKRTSRRISTKGTSRPSPSSSVSSSSSKPPSPPRAEGSARAGVTTQPALISDVIPRVTPETIEATGKDWRAVAQGEAPRPARLVS